jgi:hypothetical protein
MVKTVHAIQSSAAEQSKSIEKGSKIYPEPTMALSHLPPL